MKTKKFWMMFIMMAIISSSSMYASAKHDKSYYQMSPKSEMHHHGHQMGEHRGHTKQPMMMAPVKGCKCKFCKEMRKHMKAQHKLYKKHHKNHHHHH